MMTNRIVTIAAFCVYLIFMLCIGMYFVGKNKTTTEYFLGGRKLVSFGTSMSAQASDMSGWLLMGLPARHICPAFPPAGSASALRSAPISTGCS